MTANNCSREYFPTYGICNYSLILIVIVN
uniref:Uncharacterized protein n=1 Tax=Amphimedon queenslandica TaxID=400682 RepID=A0A1X7ULE9_AMPQE